MAKLVVSLGGREKSFDLLDEVVFVGSGADSTIRLPAEGAADKQCQILKVEDSYRIVDLTGQGTMVNGEAVTQRTLENGDRIQVGKAVLQFRGGIRPVDTAPPAAAPAQASGGSSRSSRRQTKRGSSGRRVGKEVAVAGRMKTAAQQRDVLTRKRVRKQGLSGPATAAIAVGVVTVLALVGYGLISSIGGADYTKIYLEAVAANQDGDKERAERLFASIPPEASNYRQAQKRLAEIQARDEAEVQQDNLIDGVRLYENQIKEFIKNKIDPATRLDKYDDDQPANLRYLMKRIDRFLTEFKGHKYYDEVLELEKKYRPLAPTGPPGFRDVWVEAQNEQNLKRYGYAYSLMAKWLAEHPKAEQEQAAGRRFLDGIVMSAQNYLKYEDADARQNIEGGNYAQAYNRYMTVARNVEGMGKDTPRVLNKTASELAAELQKRLNEITTKKS